MSVSLSHPARPCRFDPVAVERPPGNRDRTVQAVLRTSLSGLVGREVVALFQDRWQRLAASAVRGDLGRQLRAVERADHDPVRRLCRALDGSPEGEGQAARRSHSGGIPRSPRPLHPPTFARQPIHKISREEVENWYDRTAVNSPTSRARAYRCCGPSSAARSMTATCPLNPARIRGAGQTVRRHQIRPATLDELAALTLAMPPRYRLLIQLAAFCALRFGELTELRRADIDTQRGVIMVRRAVVLVERRVRDQEAEVGRRSA